MLMNNNTVVLLQKSIPEYLHLLNLKKKKKTHCESQFQLKLKMLGELLAKIIQLKKVFQVKSTLVLVKRPMLFEL